MIRDCQLLSEFSKNNFTIWSGKLMKFPNYTVTLSLVGSRFTIEV